jgi:predicted dinucleotide-binding enzyme
MKIGIIGAGRIGGTFGRLWANKGYQVMFGVREASSPKVQTLLEASGADARAGSVAEAAAFGEVVLLAVHWPGVEEVIRQAGDLSGKILIDVTNRMGNGSGRAAAEEIAGWARGARVVKAFNSLGSANLTQLQFGSLKADTFICGDDPAAKSVVNELARSIGFDVVDAGPLSNAVLVEALAKLWVQLAYAQGMGPDIAFKLLKRV